MTHCSPHSRSLLRIATLILLVLPTCPAMANSMEDLVATLRGQITARETTDVKVKLDWSRLQRFYLSRAYYPAWLDGEVRLARTEQLLQVLRNAANEGLDPTDYHLGQIEKLWHVRQPEQTAKLELLLTNALLRYSTHVSTGRNPPKQSDRFWRLHPPVVNVVDQVHSLLASERFDDALAALPPPHADYKRLRNALTRYRQLAQQGGWPSLTPGPHLKRGVRHKQVTTLRQRLEIEGHLVAVKETQNRHLFDSAAEQAVRRFQEHYGLTITGVVDRATRIALNTPIEERIWQIQLNMERWRWLPRYLGKRYVVVNTAGYELTAVESDKTRLNMRIIAGTPQRATPALDGMINAITFNPAWYVPWRILVEDMIPKQLRDPGYLDSKNITVFNISNGAPVEIESIDIDWSDIDGRNFPYVLRQNPGPYNSLGRIKFSFTNVYGLYLHDTPNQGLFKHATRAFSSGCIRVEHPLQLANYLLESNSSWQQQQAADALTSGTTLTIPLAKPIPIYLLYFTAWVDPDGAAHFRKDTYQQDKRPAKRY